MLGQLSLNLSVRLHTEAAAFLRASFQLFFSTILSPQFSSSNSPNFGVQSHRLITTFGAVSLDEVFLPFPISFLIWKVGVERAKLVCHTNVSIRKSAAVCRTRRATTKRPDLKIKYWFFIFSSEERENFLLFSLLDFGEKGLRN